VVVERSQVKSKSQGKGSITGHVMEVTSLTMNHMDIQKMRSRAVANIVIEATLLRQSEELLKVHHGISRLDSPQCLMHQMALTKAHGLLLMELDSSPYQCSSSGIR
jgi:hypothetical protein